MSGFAATGRDAAFSPRDSAVRNAQAYPGFTLRDLLTAVFFHKRALVLAFLIPALLGLLSALGSKPVYVSAARLLVLLGNEYVFQPTGSISGSGIALDRDQIVEGELEILQSSTLAAETLRAVGPSVVYPKANFDRPHAMELASEQLAKDLTISAVPESNVIELDFRSYDPNVAANVLKSLIDLYLQRRAEVFARGATSGADDQRAVFAKRLADSEDALATFDNAHGISDFDTQVSLLLQRKSATAAERASNDQQIAQVSAQAAAIQVRLASVPQTVQLYADSARAPAQQGLGDGLAKMESYRSELGGRYKDDFPLVQYADRQIAELKSQIAHSQGTSSDGGRSGINPIYQDLLGQEISLAAQQRGYEGRRVQLDVTAADIQSRLDELNNLGQQYRDLKRARDAQDESYRSFVHDTEAAQVSSALERSSAANIRIVQPPEPPGRGTSLRMLIAVAGVMLGGVAAVATLILLVTLRQVFVTVRDAEMALDLPVLVSVPLRGRR